MTGGGITSALIERHVVGTIDLETLLTSKQVCAILSISTKTLQRMIRRKEINYIRMHGRYRFRPTAVALFVAQREVKVK